MIRQTIAIVKKIHKNLNSKRSLILEIVANINKIKSEKKYKQIELSSKQETCYKFKFWINSRIISL
ncbi:hypothetical protein DP065_00230 [[Mycoplasma] anseris]|uniref:Uncharacterized protein n=1 Tax=[Mycoplasma] anseris TaxID=92400 RepID=A0A2Z4NCB8_9BACT|nr:hypothetical protein DP065_00230 [[Mycoplasma] anseris]